MDGRARDQSSGTGSGALPTPRCNWVGYLLVLMVVAVPCCFVRLSAGTLAGDEAAFAYTTDRMYDTGDWVVPYLGDVPHLNATPLYNWLTLATRDGFTEGPLGYRVWSALFGVGCVVLTFALGALLFRPAVGFLAGLFLVLNRDFIFSHGVRFGGMDALLTFFVTAATLSYAWLQGLSGRIWWAWGLVGLFIGLAWLSKPPVFGAFFLCGIGVHFLWTRRATWPACLAGPLLALAVALVVAAPWYVLLWFRLGNSSLHQLFIHNSVERALDGARDYFWVGKMIWRSSNSFHGVHLALVCAGACWFAGVRRAQWGLLLFLAGSYLLALSATGKWAQYPFYVFPLLAVFLAGLFLESGPWLVQRFWSGLGSQRIARVGILIVVILIGLDCLKALSILKGPEWVHPTVGIYRRLAADLEQGECHLVLFDFASPLYEDSYYAPHLQRAERVENIAGLKLLLADRKPAIVVLQPGTSAEVQSLLTELHPEVRIEDSPFGMYRYPVFAFQGALDRVPLAELTRLVRANQP
jgi:4-amino-4-deoxy-L-arabinose transferase-like glycosyltransferase